MYIWKQSVLEIYEEHSDFKTTFMNPNSPSKSYFWKEVEEVWSTISLCSSSCRKSI